MKLFGSWGRYFDWTKYEIARGSFGGDIWHIYYRSLDTLDIGSLNLNNMPGQDIWGSSTGFRDLRVDAIREHRSQHQADVPGQLQRAGSNISSSPTTRAERQLRAQQPARTIEDFSALVDGDNVYVIGTLARASPRSTPASYPATANFATPKPKRQYDALELSSSRRFSKNWFASANYTLSRLYGNYSGLANSDEILTPTTGISVGTTQQQSGSIAASAATRTPAGTSTSPVGFARQPRRRSAGWRRIVRTS